MEVKDLIYVLDDAININVVSRLLKVYCKREFEESKVGSPNHFIINKKIRDVGDIPLNNSSSNLCDVHWYNVLYNIFSKAIHKYIENKNLRYIFTYQVTEMAILKYGLNQKYNYHVDNGKGIARNFSCILLLNNDYEGGELCFKNPNDTDEMVIENRPGRIIIWPSNFMYPHTVKPVTKGTRYSIVAWAI